MVNALFLSFSGYSEYNGISKKKLAQVRGLKECGLNVANCYYTVRPADNHRVWMVDNAVLIDLGKGITAKLRKRTDYAPILAYIRKNHISFVYMRSEHNANPFLIRFIKRLRRMDIKVVMEIPTYPYDQEYSGFRRKCGLLLDQLFRKSLARQLNTIVTFSNESKIFGQRTIRVSNGIDFDAIKLKKQKDSSLDEIHLIGVAEIHYWHGFDRVVAGLAGYYKSDRYKAYKVYFHIVGEFSGERERSEILPLIMGNHLEEYVILHGALYGSALDDLFDQVDIGIGSLGRHRSNITHIKTLKNREYAARGIPFIYSETDQDFEGMPYTLKIPAEESPIDIEQVIDFYDHVTVTPEKIRNSVQHLSWKDQMRKVLDSLNSNNYED